MESKPMRLRCPKDSLRETHLHLAIDVRLPCDVRVLGELAKALPRCGCGAKLAIATEPS